jgi:hypothetical protein
MTKRPDFDCQPKEEECEFECRNFLGTYRGKAHDVHVALIINWAGRLLLAAITAIAAYMSAPRLPFLYWL